MVPLFNAVAAIEAEETVPFAVAIPSCMFMAATQSVIAAQIAFVSYRMMGFHATQASRTVGAVLDVTFASGRYVVYILMIAMIRV